MALIGSDGLSVLIGDGAPTEGFTVLKGAQVTRLEISQRLHPGNAIASDAWQTQVGASERHAIVECEAYASDDGAVLRLKTLAMSGASGNVKLQLRSAEALCMNAIVAQYREEIAPGEVKRLLVRLESSGAVSLG